MQRLRGVLKAARRLFASWEQARPTICVSVLYSSTRPGRRFIVAITHIAFGFYSISGCLRIALYYCVYFKNTGETQIKIYIYWIPFNGGWKKDKDKENYLLIESYPVHPKDTAAGLYSSVRMPVFSEGVSIFLGISYFRTSSTLFCSINCIFK